MLASKIFRRASRLPGQVASSPTLHRIIRALVAPPKKEPVGSIQEAKHILIIKPDEIGDVILATGFLRALRSQCPNARVTLLVRQVCAELVAGAGYADEIMILPESWRNTRQSPSSIWEICHAARKRWAQAPPDWVLVPRSGLDVAGTAFYAHWTSSPQVSVHDEFCATSHPDCRTLFPCRIPTQEPVHEIERHRAMFRHLGLNDGVNLAPCLPDSPSGREACARFLEAQGLTGRSLVSIGIGAGMPDKVWPLANFLDLARQLVAHRPDLHLIIVGGQQDSAAASELCSLLPEDMTDATGKLSLTGSRALLEQCLLHVGNDSGPVHLAASAGTPVVVISKHPLGGSDSASHSPARFGPISSHHRIVRPHAMDRQCMAACRYTNPHCILNIPVNSVLATVLELLPEP